METNEVLSTTWEDLVFKNRNKEYGAYVIRQTYSRNVAEAIGGSLVVVALVLLSPQLSLLRGTQNSVLPNVLKPPVILTHVPTIIKVIPKREMDRHQPVKKATQNFHVTSQEVPDLPIEMEPATNSATPGMIGEPQTETQSSAVGIDLPIISPPAGPVNIAEIMPTYEGGVEAMIKFLRKKMHYPLSARKMETEGIVFVQFVVDQVGSVTQVQVVRGISQDCDKEASRVVALMPPWKPGRNGNYPVSVRMVLPINFRLGE